MTQAVEDRATSAGARVVFALLSAVLVVVSIGSIGLLLSAAARAGDLGAIFHPGLDRLGDPKDSMSPIGPDSASNPLVWIFGLSRVAAFFVRPIALLATAAGIVALIPAWLTRNRASAKPTGANPAGVRSRRAIVWLGSITGAWMVVAAISFTPYGAALLGWLLD
jgi:hypothetical protein